MKRLLLSALLLFFLAGCARNADNLIFVNDSAASVGLVELAGPGYSGGGCYADGSPIGRGDSLGFRMDPDEGGVVSLRVWDEGARAVLAQGTFSLSFEHELRYTVTLSERGGRPVLLLEELSS